MKLKKGDTVKILPSFAFDEQGETQYPDANEVGKYAKIIRNDKFDIQLLDGGAVYGALLKHLEKTTFSIVDHYGSDDTDEPWMGGGLAEFDPYGEEDDEESYQSA